MRTDVSTASLLGRQIGHFRVVDFVASGGMGAAIAEARALRATGFGRRDFVTLCRTLGIE
jgi:hypothetical protein